KPILPPHARKLLQNGNAYFLGSAGIDRRFINNDRTAFHVFAYRLARPCKRSEIGLVRGIHRRWYRNDQEIGIGKSSGIVCNAELAGRAQILAGYLSRRIVET